MLNETVANMAFPLLASLDFIKKVTIEDHKETEVTYDFDKMREIGQNYTGHISRWYFYVYTELTCNLAEPIFITKSNSQYDIVINRTTRYMHPAWDYLIFREFSHRMTFVGLEDEYRILKAKLPEMIYKPVNDFLELAEIIQNSSIFVGNQSMAFALAEITKTKRALEVCPFAHNVIPTGANGYDFLDPFKLKTFLNAPNKNI